jgi:ubiquinol-cytochrome c reductase cytochrome b subunit
LGYSLPDDLLSGTGIRIAEAIIQALPLVGSYLAFFAFGGAFPGEAFIPRIYTVHVLLLPGAFLSADHSALNAGLVPEAHSISWPWSH